MIAWFNTLPAIEQVFFFIAVPATVVLLIQTIALFVGGDGGDMDLSSDTSGLDTGGIDFDVDPTDFDFDASSGTLDTGGLHFFTLRGIIVFLTIAGWAGVCSIEAGASNGMSVAMSVILGALCMVGMAYLVRGVMRLQSSGNINYRHALGQSGSVYLQIPATGEGQGKVSLSLDGGLSEFDAVTNEKSPIKTGEIVRVTDIIGDSTLVVERER